MGIHSSSWTGRAKSLRIPHPKAVLWWLVTGVRKSICPHAWAWDRCVCNLCGVTMEACEDHCWSWRCIPTVRRNSFFVSHGRIFQGFEI